MPQPKRKAKKPAAAKRKPAAKRPPEPEIQVDRQPTPPEEIKPVTDTPTQDPPLFEGTKDELDENGETQADRDAAGAARREKVMAAGKPDAPEDYEPKRDPLDHAGFDHVAAEEDRQAELEAEREEHNERTGDASLSNKGSWS